MEEIENQFKCLVGGYYGVELMDDYELKPYVLIKMENYIKDFIVTNPIENYDYKVNALKFREELSSVTKLQDSLLFLHKIDAPMELIFLIKLRIKQLKEKNDKKEESI